MAIMEGKLELRSEVRVRVRRLRVRLRVFCYLYFIFIYFFLLIEKLEKSLMESWLKTWL